MSRPDQPSNETRSPAPLAGLAAFLLCGAAFAQTGNEFAVVDLGTLPSGGRVEPRAVDAYGRIVGQAYAFVPTPTGGTRGVWHPFILAPDNGVYYRDDDGDGANDLLVDLGTLPNSNPNYYPDADALDINDNGVVVGWSQLSGAGFRAVAWVNGAITDLGLPDGSKAVAINNQGHIVGTMNTALGNPPGFLLDGGVVPLPFTPTDINDSGQVVGWQGNPSQAFLWNGATMVLPSLTGDDLGARAEGIGPTGLVAGQSVEAGGSTFAVSWSPSLQVLRSSIFAAAGAVNQLEEVTINDTYGFDYGYIWLPNPNYSLGAGLYQLDDLYTPTPSLNIRLRTVWSINDAGQMVGEGEYGGGGGSTGWVMSPTGYVPPPPPPPFGVFSTAADYDFSGWVADPVNTLTGEFVQPELPDLVLGGPMSVAFSRYYASGLHAAGRSGLIGINWRHNYEWSLTYGPNGEALILTPRGRLLSFDWDGSAWSPSSSHRGNPWELKAASGWLYLKNPRSELTYIFDSVSGQMQRIQDPRGRALAVSYDGNGNPIRIDDLMGRAIQLTWDPGTGELTRITDGDRTVTYVHSGDDLTQVTDVSGRTTSYTYQPDGLMLTIVRPEGNVPVSNVYDAQGRVTSQTDGAGHVTTFSYLGVNTEILDPLAGKLTHTHSMEGELVDLAKANGGGRGLGYDPKGRRLSHTDKLGNTTTFVDEPTTGKAASITYPDGTSVVNSFTSVGSGVFAFMRLTGRAYPDGTTESFTWDPDGRLSQVIDRGGFVTSYQNQSRLETITNPLGGKRTNYYRNDGTLSEVRRGTDVTRYRFDRFGYPREVTHPDGTRRRFFYGVAGELAWEIDENGRRTSYDHDDNGNLVGREDPLGHRSQIAYDGLDRVVSVTDPLGNVTRTEYDPLGRVAKLVNARGGETLFSYDASDRLLSTTTPEGRVLSQTWDAAGRLIELADSLGQKTMMSYDGSGRLVSSTDPLGEVTSFGYDLMGQTTSITDPLGRTTQYAYEDRGLLSRVDAPGGLFNVYTYDAMGGMTQLEDALGAQWGFGYDDRGRMTSATDPLGLTTQFSYDSRSRRDGATYPQGFGWSRAYFDGVGNVVEQSFADGTRLGFQYDVASQLVKATRVSLAREPGGAVIESNGLDLTRDELGRVTRVELAPGRELVYTWDGDDNLVSVTDWLGGGVTLSWDAAGRLVGMDRANQVATVLQYDAAGRLTQVAEDRAGQPVSDIQLSRDELGRIETATRSVPQMPQVAAANDAWTADLAGQVTGHGHDPLGRRTSDSTGSYQWDLAGRLTGVTTPAGSVSFGHDAYGQVVERADGSGIREYVRNYGFDHPVPMIVRSGDRDLWYWVFTPQGELLYAIDVQTGQHRYHHADERGSVIFLTDGAGQVTDSYAYDPFGVPAGASGSTENPFRYLGRLGVMAEGEEGLYLTYRRPYDARTGRFLAREPFPREDDPSLVNRYQYAAGDPVNQYDWNGESPQGSAAGANAAGSFVDSQEYAAGKKATEKVIGEVVTRNKKMVEGAAVLQQYVDNSNRIHQMQRVMPNGPAKGALTTAHARNLLDDIKGKAKAVKALDAVGTWGGAVLESTEKGPEPILETGAKELFKKAAGETAGRFANVVIEGARTNEAVVKSRKQWQKNRDSTVGDLSSTMDEARRDLCRGAISVETYEMMFNLSVSGYVEGLGGVNEAGSSEIYRLLLEGAIKMY